MTSGVPTGKHNLSQPLNLNPNRNRHFRLRESAQMTKSEMRCSQLRHVLEMFDVNKTGDVALRELAQLAPAKVLSRNL